MSMAIANCILSAIGVGVGLATKDYNFAGACLSSMAGWAIVVKKEQGK